MTSAAEVEAEVSILATILKIQMATEIGKKDDVAKDHSFV